jgi:hypothetical protein
MAAEKFKYLRTLWGTGAPTVMQVVVGDSQTIIKGDLIKVDASNGKAILGGAAAAGIIGIALHDITTGTAGLDSQTLEVIAIDSKSVLRIANYTAGSVDAATSAMCWGKAKYDYNGGLIDFNDTTNGYMIPVTVSSGGYTDVVISATALWNA